LPAATVHHAGDISETITRSAGQGFLGPLVGGVADEFGDGLTPDGGRSLHLFVEVWIEPKASHYGSVSRFSQSVLHRVAIANVGQSS
jgi:hypothetical protein